MCGTYLKASFLLLGQIFIYYYFYIYFRAVGINIPSQALPAAAQSSQVCTLLTQNTHQESCTSVPRLQKKPQYHLLGQLKTAASLIQMLPGNGPIMTTEYLTEEALSLNATFLTGVVREWCLGLYFYLSWRFTYKSTIKQVSTYFFLPCRRAVVRSETLSYERSACPGTPGMRDDFHGEIGNTSLASCSRQRARQHRRSLGNSGWKMNSYPKPLRWLLQEVRRNC